MPEASAARSPCENCGGTFVWDAASRKLRCASCDELRDGPDPGIVLEHDLRDLLRANPHGRLGAGSEQVKCRDCGAEVELTEGQLAARCPFCASPQVLCAEARSDRVQPESVIPFAITPAQARSAFATWLGRLWFRPLDLATRSTVAELRGVYVPYWTFSADVTSAWTADAGYRSSERVVIPRREVGKPRVRTVQHIRWKPARGTRHDRHDDHLVCASAGLPDDQARSAAESFDAGELVAFSTDYLLGFSAESYAVDLPEAWKRAQRDLARLQQRRCAGDVPGDTHRGLRASHRFDGVTVKLALVPLWIAAFRYRGRSHRFLVNGQSGEVAGAAPLSLPRIALAVLAVAALVLAAVVLLRR